MENSQSVLCVKSVVQFLCLRRAARGVLPVHWGGGNLRKWLIIMALHT
jgi:hypothetical protein